MTALRDWLAAFKPARITADGRERARACIGALIGIFTTGITSYWLIGNTPQLPMLIAPLGASAVLLFAVPNGPLAQPWPLVGGNTLSAIVGVTALLLFDNIAIAAAVGVGGAIGVMFLTRSLHPPGGAVALATVMGGDAVLQQGYYWALVPVGLESMLLLVIGLLYNNLTGRRYPPLPARPVANPHNTADAAPGRRMGFTQADLEKVLERYKQVLDVSPAELGMLLKQTELQAWRRRMGAILCSDIMSRDVVTARADMPLIEAWSRMHEHRIKALPVVDDTGHIQGILTQFDLLEHAGLDGAPDVHAKLNGLLERSGVPGAGCVGDIMTSPAETAGTDEHIGVLVPKLTEGGRHHIPIVDGQQRLVGIVTQTDLVSALYHGETPQG